MSLLSPYIEAEHHREAASALLRYLVPHGRRGAFSKQVGISASHLSQILAVDDLPRQPDRRNPSPALIERIVHAVPAPLDVRESLRDHLLGARCALDRGRRGFSHNPDQLSEQVWEVRHASHQATYAPDGVTASHLYRTVVTAGRELAELIDPDTHPFELVELYLCLHDALCVLDDSATALYYALTARDLLEFQPCGAPSGGNGRRGELEVNAGRAVGVAYSNLNQLKAAQLAFQSAQALQAAQNRAADWAPHFSRDLLTVLYKAPWLTLKAVDRIVSRAEMVARGEMSDTFRLLMYIKRADCFTAFGHTKDARRQLDSLGPFHLIDAKLGPLHQATFMTGYLKLAVKEGDQVEAAAWGRKALRLAADAGLMRQMRSAVGMMRRVGITEIVPEERSACLPQAQAADGLHRPDGTASPYPPPQQW